MKIIIVGPAHPYRGGLAKIMERMGEEYTSRGDEVSLLTFTLQYPSLLFPGESQTLTTPPPEELTIERCVNSINPLNWWHVGRRIAREAPDIVIMKYWTPFLAPCFGTIARVARSNGHTRVICQVDNVEPHERRVIDAPLNRYFLRSMDGFIYMSEQVHRELQRYTSAPAIYSPHPMFESFGEAIPREAAARSLGLDPECRYALFFGLIREYKGLDILLDGWAQLKAEGATKGRKLIVAGEFYTDKRPYLERIERLGIGDDVILHDHFIDDHEVVNYFSLSDFIVLPYHTATQSGVTQIAYNFSLPMVVTEVGGLPEIVAHDRVGYVCPPTVGGVAEAIRKIWNHDTLQRMRANMPEERRRFSWGVMCDRIVELYREYLSRS